MPFLSDFFPEVPSGSPGRAVYRVHRKKGHPFALLPDGLFCQKELASLLPGQSLAARLYRLAVRWQAATGRKFPREAITLPLDPDSPLIRLVRELGQSNHPPVLLPGNPHGSAPRLVLIALTNAIRPTAVVKAGKTPDARNLVRREHDFLKALPATQGIPQVLGFVDEPNGTAFGMEFAEGNSPRWPTDPKILEATLTPWVDPTRSETIGNIPLWRALLTALDQAAAPKPDWLAQMADLRIHPCRFHGDFAPWNVREDSAGRWTAIDWENGEFQGIPGWDWLHYFIQPAWLLHRMTPRRLANAIKSLVFSDEFQRYLHRSGLQGWEQCLVLSYLDYCEYVFRPHGLLENLRDLRSHLLQSQLLKSHV